MRIVQIVESLRVGGLETMALQLAIGHRNAGHQSSLYTIFERGDLADEAEAGGVSVVCFRKAPGFRPGAIMRIARQLRDDRAQVVHTHNSGIHHYGVMAGRLAGVKAIVSTRHGLAFHSRRRQELYYRAVLPFTDAVVFVCEDGHRHYRAIGSAPANRSSVILNGIRIEKFQALRAAPGACLPKIRFGTVGRLVKAKGHNDLIEAFAIIAPELPHAELHIWGHGELEADLRRDIAARSLEGRVQYHGTTTNSAEALHQLDLFIMSSISEGLPLVILEAMAAGLPIISTRVGGVPEVAPEGVAAWYCDRGNPRALAAIMIQAARSDLAAAGDAAYHYAAQHFSVETMQQCYEELFSRFVGAGRNPCR